MLKRLWNTLTSSGDESAEKRAPVAGNKLQLFASHFRIGRKILYFPEFHEKSVLHTIVMAYRVNDRYVYSADALIVDTDDVLQGFRISANEEVPLERVHRFQLLLPDTSEMEKKLDYFTRAELGPAGHLRSGNTITLVCDSAERCLPTVDVVIQRKQEMEDGPYEGSPTVLATPDFSTLKINDKRRQQRVHAAIWADLYHVPGATAFPCVLRDFSENSLRLGTTDPGGRMPELAVGKPAAVEFDFGSVDTTYRIRGKIIRSDVSSCVLQMEQIYSDGNFERIRLMDVVEIKTRLLNLSYDPKSL